MTLRAAALPSVARLDIIQPVSQEQPKAIVAAPKSSRALDQVSVPEDPVEATRMSIGAHLDELRARLIRALLGLLGGCLLAIWPSQYVLMWTIQPLLVAQQANDQPLGLLATSPTETLVWYVKVVLFVGAIISSPYVIHQIWAFVAAGLYPREKKVVYRYIPYSVGLFVAGVGFMYTFVLLLSLHFLIAFSNWFPIPGVDSTGLQRMMIGESGPPTTTQPIALDGLRAPLLAVDPDDPSPGDVWFNLSDGELKIRGADRTFSQRFERDGARRASVTTHFKIGEYLSFVLMLALAFGLAFQVPLVVMALVRAGIMSNAQLREYRKVVILAIVIIAGAIAPPDLLSHILLSVPMILLFELGLLLSRDPQPKAKSAASS